MADTDSVGQSRDGKGLLRCAWACSRIRSLIGAAFVFAMATVVAASAWQTPDSPASNSRLVEVGESLLEDGRSTLDESTLAAARKTFTDCTGQDAKDFRCYYDLARTDSYLASVKGDQKDTKAAQHCLDSAIENAKRAINLDNRSSDAHALLAGLYGLKIGLGGMFAGMKYGPEANAEVERAFQLDANNPRAYVVVGRKYLFAPKMFGGDLARAIESFQKATAIDPRYDEAFVWLSIAYRKKGDAPRAQAALSEALRLNGRSAFAQRTLSETRKAQ